MEVAQIYYNIEEVAIC